MNKGEFVKAIAAKSGAEIKTTGIIFDALIDVVAATLKKGEKIQIAGFGSIELKTRKARTGVNPTTKKTIKIPSSKAPVFKFGKAYKDLFN